MLEKMLITSFTNMVSNTTFHQRQTRQVGFISCLQGAPKILLLGELAVENEMFQKLQLVNKLEEKEVELNRTFSF